MDLLQFDKVERESIASKVYEHIKQKILSGDLLPGTHLLETQIAEQMGVSRSPLREAFRLLQAYGLVETRASQGVFVRDLTADEVREIYTARRLIEGYAASLAAQRATPEDIERLRRAMERADGAARKEDYQATIIADFDLHRLIWEISGHKVVYDILTRLEVQIRMFMVAQAPLFEDLYDSVRDHQRVIEAVAHGDAEAARAGIEQHIIEAGTLVISRIEQEQEESNHEQPDDE